MKIDGSVPPSGNPIPNASFPRRRESTTPRKPWTPPRIKSGATFLRGSDGLVFMALEVAFLSPFSPWEKVRMRAKPDTAKAKAPHPGPLPQGEGIFSPLAARHDVEKCPTFHTRWPTAVKTSTTPGLQILYKVELRQRIVCREAESSDYRRAANPPCAS